MSIETCRRKPRRLTYAVPVYRSLVRGEAGKPRLTKSNKAAELRGEGRNDMPEQAVSAETTAREVPAEMSSAPFPTNSSKKSVARHVLKFEEPLAQLEQQILELEAMQVAKQIDYSKELRQ